MENKREYEYVGPFELSQHRMIITDPSYEKYSDLIIANCLPGKWNAFVNRNKYLWGKERRAETRVATLFAAHESLPESIFDTVSMIEDRATHSYRIRWDESWRRFGRDIGVDSAQLGIFDAEKYGRDDLFEYAGKCGFGDKWYSNCCDATNDEGGAGIIANCGVNAEAGLGDGCYPALIHRTNGKADAIAVFFLGDNEEVEVR